MPTLRCLGVRWLIGGDANRNARVTVHYRGRTSRNGGRAWICSASDSAAVREAVVRPAGQTLYAGSVFGLQEGTAYEVKLSLVDPDGGNAERIVPMTTWAEPQLAEGNQRDRRHARRSSAASGGGQTGADVAACTPACTAARGAGNPERRTSRSASSRPATAKWCWTARAATP